jgi:hypothetical protein
VVVAPAWGAFQLFNVGFNWKFEICSARTFSPAAHEFNFGLM